MRSTAERIISTLSSPRRRCIRVRFAPDLKAWTTRRLKLRFDADRENWWAERGSIRWLWKEDDLAAAIQYVTEGQEKPRIGG